MVKGLDVPKPPLHKYVEAPMEVSMVESPKHIGFAAAVMLIVGIGFTVMVILEVAVQPKEFPVTE